MTEVLPGHSQRKTPQWDGLIAIAQDSIRQELPYEQQHEAAANVWEAVAPLDDETIEANRYYGLGVVGRGYVQAFFNEPGMERFVDDRARLQVAKHVDYCDSWNLDQRVGLYLKEVGHRLGTALPSKAQLEKLYADLPMEVRLVTNALEILKPFILPSMPHKEYDVPNILNGAKDPAYRTLAVNALNGARFVVRLALIDVYNGQTGEGKSYGDPSFNPAIRDFASNDIVAALDLENASMIFASMRHDEASRMAEPGMQAARSGRKSIPLPKDPGPIADGDVVKHQHRLRCPLLFVEGAIPHVAEAMPKLIVATQERLLPS